ncbi:MAG: 30S ribosomal protein S12 methylthiotransferase RimO [Candidatus Aminicenantes bacterium]|nr:30S ribosomal protein S12 methylthiotransferase RimO [Candidatus Aminicenantes bacterium]
MDKQETTLSFVSLGCFKNIVDTEVLGGMLENHNIKIVSTYEDSDWVVINTCGFIQEAKEESIDEILRALERKEKGEIKKVAVIGCLTQRYYQDLKKYFKNADIIWGVNDFSQLARLIAANKKQNYSDKGLFLYDENHERIIITTPNTTFIKISEGCDMTCSFCAIPQIRGPYRSRTTLSIVKEAEKYLAMGFQEVNIISQNTTYFGKDKGQKSLLPRLLKDLSTLGFKWIRVLYLMPEEVDEDIVEAFSNPSILPYFDLPFQHLSPAILKRMKRGGGIQKNLELINTIRKEYPNGVIRSTFIVGFPGETDREFRQLVQFTRDSAIERIGIFGFSPEENTPAFNLKNRVYSKVIEERKNTLMDISDQNIQIFNKRLLNTIQEFIPLGPWENNSTIGRIKSQAPEVDGFTQIKSPFDEDYKIKKVRITGFKNEFLYGEMI